MDILNKLFGTASDVLGKVTNLGIKLIAAGVVLQILFGAAVPFLGIDVVGAITKFVGSLGDQGLVGLVALGVIFYSFNKQ